MRLLAHLDLSREELSAFTQNAATQLAAERPVPLARYLSETFAERSPKLRTAYELNVDCDVVFSVGGRILGAMRVYADPFRFEPTNDTERRAHED